MQLLVVSKSHIVLLDLRPMRCLEALLASGSALRKIITEKADKLITIEIDNTYMVTIPPESVPGLVRLSIQGSMVQLLDLR